ncbi:hypothetical protein [Paraburkholderia aromaticivorans]|uniref:bestrophin-like domain n=1 Tax=Paraburkholderia aromaticivorans TaxID=2026199 RepID=UPI00145623A3|nr:hypothetical protein [Paraburkholderia aromaticivorans]
MNVIVDHPVIVLVFSLLLLWLSAFLGARFSTRRGKISDEARDDFAVVQAATLTLLGLIIGFSFSMAVSRYDQRKAYEEEEANAIGTEYSRADLLPAADGEKVRALLIRYTNQRVLFYTVRDANRLETISLDTARLQTDLWSAVRAPVLAQPTPIAALVVSGMNDVLNSDGYTEAAWRNRIPLGAWVLMFVVAILCNVLVGYGKRTPGGKGGILVVWPLVVSISFALIADVDSPRVGVIKVAPQNLLILERSLKPQ